MTTSIARLKSAKGVPPQADQTPDVIASNPRTEVSETVPLQLRIPKAMFEAFSEQAGREFGFTKGSKSQFFMKLWGQYKR